MDAEFSVIEGFPGYVVTKDGRVYSWRKGDPKPVAAYTDRNGFSIAVLVAFTGQAAKHRMVHRLVWESFVGEIPSGMEPIHKDGNRSNNALSNLDWDKRRAKGLSDDDIREIRASRGKERQVETARDFGISQVMVSLIQRRKQWAHIKDKRKG